VARSLKNPSADIVARQGVESFSRAVEPSTVYPHIIVSGHHDRAASRANPGVQRRAAPLLAFEDVPQVRRECRRGTLDAIVDHLRQGREVRALTDRVVSPGYTPDIAAATRHLIDADAPSGLYHCVNSGHATWESVAREAARLLGVEPRIVPITVDQLTLAAARPAYCAMDTSKLAGAGFCMPAWDDALRRWLLARAGEAA